MFNNCTIGKAVHEQKHQELSKIMNRMESMKTWVHYQQKPTYEQVMKDLKQEVERITYCEIGKEISDITIINETTYKINGFTFKTRDLKMVLGLE